MSYCPRPDATSKTNYTTPATKTVSPGAPRTEACGASSSEVVSGGGSNTSTEVYVPGLPGPQGKDGWGFKWEGQFELNKQYYKQSDTHPLASVVQYADSSYVAVTDNISTTEENPEFEPGASPAWQLIAKKGEAGVGGLNAEDKNIFDYLKDAADWIEKASIEDLLLAGLAAAGIIWAGSKVIDMFTPDASNGDGNADSRFTGSPGFVTTAFVPPKVKDVIASLCSIESIPNDVTALDDSVCTFTIGQVTSIRAILEQLSLAYQFTMVDTGGVLRFVPVSSTAVATITLDDLGWGVSTNGVPPAPYSTKRLQGIDLPKQVNLQYQAESIDYNIYTQTADLLSYSNGQVVNLAVPVTLTHEKAKEIVETSLINAHLQRMNYTFTTNYAFIHLECGDVVDSPMGKVRVTRLSEGDVDGLLNFEAVDAGTTEAVLGSNMAVAIPPPSTNIPTVVGYSQTFWIDPPNVDDNDKGIRLYAAVHGFDVDGWPGASLYMSEDAAGGTSEVIGTANKEATVGLVEVAIGSGDYMVWDNTTVITVKVLTNSLSSSTQIDVLNGANLCMIGQEVLKFTTATLVAEKTYELTGLLRGRQGTEQFIGTHGANELFVMLDDALVRVSFPKADRFTVKKFKTVTNGSSPDKVEWEDVGITSNNVRMWTPIKAKVVKTGDDFTFTWKGRVRYNNGLIDMTATNNDEDYGGFGLIMYAPDGTTKKGNYTTSGETFVYTAAMQTADYGSVQTTMIADIAELNKDYGPGYSVRVTV